MQITHKSTNKPIFLILLFSIVFIVLSTVNTVSANNSTIYVNGSSGNDSWNGEAPIWDGTGLIGPKKSIKNAIETVSEGGIVNIADGNYNGENNTNIIINKNMTIKGQSQTGTIIQGTESYFAIFQVQSGLNITIHNLIVLNCYNHGSGGAIRNMGNLTVENCNFTNNVASGHGGAIYSMGNLTVKNSIFTGNSAGNNGGGAISSQDGILTIEDCNFTNNNAAFSGAVCNYGPINITRSNFTNNNANNEAGAIGVWGYSNGVPSIITYCKFTNNTAFCDYSIMTRGEGGAINNGRDLTIENCIFINNYAFQGGAIYNQGALAINNSIFTGTNGWSWASSCGGAIFGGNFNINNCTFTNSSASYGGAVYGDNFIINSSTFTNNTAEYGGAIYGSGNVHFNRILGNTASTGSDLYCNSGTLDATNNWWGSNNPNSSRFIEGADGNIIYNPWLILKINGTPTLLPKNGNSMIMADLTWNIYDMQPLGGHIPDSIQINFNTSLGTILNSSTLNGIAQSTLNSGIISGVADISAALDNEIVHTFINIDATAPVVTADSAGIFVSKDIITVILSSEPNAIIYYTLNGINWYSFVGSGTVLISNTGTNSLEFYAVDVAGNPSAHTTYSYTIDKTAPTSSASINGGLYNANKVVYLTMSEPGTIYYTTNGVTPTTSSTKYTGPITIAYTTTLKWFAVDLAGNPSSVYTQTYSIDKTAPRITSTYPRNFATGVSRTSTIVIRFSEKIKASSYWSKIVVKNKYGRAVSISKWISGNTLYIKTSYKRSSYSYYTVYIPYAAIKDYAGNNLRAGYSFRFKTGRY